MRRVIQITLADVAAGFQRFSGGYCGLTRQSGDQAGELAMKRS
jgi:hypothetical protein